MRNCKTCSFEVVSHQSLLWHPALTGHGIDRRKKPEEETMKDVALGTVIVLVAVSLVAGNAIGAERMVIVDHFTATW